MAPRTASRDKPSPQRALLIVAALLAVVIVAAVLFRSATESASSESAPTPSGASPQPTASNQPSQTPITSPQPTPTSEQLTLGLPDVDGALDIDPAPLGSYVVAKPAAGIRRAGTANRTARLEIPVYDEPFGPPRSLLSVSEVDGVQLPITLTNWGGSEGALVLRLIAGGRGDPWLIVQAPTRPHDHYVWVRASDFDFGFTNQRIEIDLAGGGELSLYEGDRLQLSTAIVQGREGRETPTHLTYIERGIGENLPSPAYGAGILSMASFSEQLATFGGGGLPSNFIHGTNQPELMGQRLSSGEIRVPNEVLTELIESSSPGTPVLLFDSSGARPGRDSILARIPTPAKTIRFLDGGVGAADATTGIVPQLWRRCRPGDLAATIRLLCRNDSSTLFIATGDWTGDHAYAVARPDSGERIDGRLVIPVFDEPEGEMRSLVYTNPVIGVDRDFPLFAETVFGERLLLSIVASTSDGEWFQVRAPVLPHNRSVWVRSSDFDVERTSIRVEVDIGYEFLGRQGILVVWDDNTEVLAAKISAGRDSRPTTLTSTYVDQILVGTDLSAAYGPWILSTPSYSETLGTFGGGGLPQQSIHGIRAEIDDVLGQPASSGSIHVSYETIEAMVTIDGILGAPVFFYDSRSRQTWVDAIKRTPLRPAETRPFVGASLEQPVGSFT